MVIGFLLALNMGAQDTVSPPLTPDYDFYTETVQCETWKDVRLYRTAANKAGFGSVSKLKDDGSYDLSFVFVGNKKSTVSQLNRLNEVLKEPLAMLEKPTDISKPTEELAQESNQKEEQLDKEHAQINVSGKFEKIMVSQASTAGTEKHLQTPNEESNTRTTNSSKPLALKSEEDKGADDRAMRDFEPNIKSKNKGSTKTFITDSTPSSKQTITPNQKSLKPATQTNTSSTVQYAIIFGSFTNISNAYRLRDRLEKEGIDAKVLPFNSAYRVGITYSEYPRQAIKDFKTSHPKIWLLRND